MASGAIAEQQLRQAADIAWNLRWHLAQDMNGDGATTISDVWLWFKYIFFAPGDWLFLIIMTKATGLALFLEMSPQMLYGGLSGTLSAIVWLVIVSLANSFDP